MRPRLAEIARRAGVSVSTVSRVLNDQPGVTDQTRQQVLTALDVLGLARPELLRPRAGLVGIVVPELENPFFPRIVQVLGTNLITAGYTPVLCSEGAGGVHEDAYVPMLLEHGVAGIVFVSGVHAIDGTDPGHYARLVDRGLPMAMINGYLPAVRAGFFTNDDLVGMDLAVAHLVSMGHTQIGAALGERRYTPVLRKEEGFRAAIRRHVAAEISDTDLDELVVTTRFTVEGGSLGAGRLLDRGVTAIVCGSDVMALGAVRAARRRGLDVPGDVSVVGADDSLLAEFADPPLTTTRQPVVAMATAAVRSVVDQIEGLDPDPGEMLFSPELVARSSTGRAP